MNQRAVEKYSNDLSRCLTIQTDRDGQDEICFSTNEFLTFIENSDKTGKNFFKKFRIQFL